MKSSLTGFKDTFREQTLDLLWRQWTTLGIAGHMADWQGAPIDPEALLLSSCTMTRYDARLFDAMLEWMEVNGRFINVQRLMRILSNEPFRGESVFRALADMTKDSVSSAKWRRSADAGKSRGKPVPLFHLSDGRPMPLVGKADSVFLEHGFLRDRYQPRRVAGPFKPQLPANLLLRLRAFLGVNARSEIIAFLLINGRGSPRSVARYTYYTPATIAKALDEMRRSGYVISHTTGRRRYHRLIPDTWRELLLGRTQSAWVVWPRLLSALEEIWIFLHNRTIDRKSPLAQASALRRLLLGSSVERFDTSIPDFTFGDVSAHPGEALIPFFTSRVVALFDHLDRIAGG